MTCKLLFYTLHLVLSRLSMRLSTLALPLLIYPLVAVGSDNKPNIIFFLVDDMGWQDTSVPFWRDADGQPKETYLNKRYRTPNMERLAANSMLFTRAYACPVSSPTRTSLMTGINAAKHRVTNWTLNCDQSTDSRHPNLQSPEWSVNGLQPLGTPAKGHTTQAITGAPLDYKMTKPCFISKTLPQKLQRLGYRTIHVGKAHWGTQGTPGANPLNLGFDYNIAGRETGGPANYRGSKKYGQASRFAVQGLDESRFYDEDVFLTQALTIKAIEQLDKLKKVDKPFYLYMSLYAIHAPFDARGYNKHLAPKYSNPNDGHPWNNSERNYSTLIEGMDLSLGALMDWLKLNGEDENTIIIFMSDNGGLSVCGRMAQANAPLKHGKGSLHEGGIRVPMMVKWPRKTAGGRINNSPVIIEDFFPSIIEMAGGKARALDGKSFLPLLRGKESEARPLLFHLPNSWVAGLRSEAGYGAGSALVYGDWKIIYQHEAQQIKLYNLSDDIGEKNEVSGSQPARAMQMARLLSKELRQSKALMPSYKANNPHGFKTGSLVPMPDKSAAFKRLYGGAYAKGSAAGKAQR